MQVIEYDSDTQTHTIHFKGKLTGSLCQDLASETEAAVRKVLTEKADAKLAFDLAKVDFVASAFLRICISAAKQLPNDRFAIVNCRPEVKRVFSIAGMDRLTAMV